MRETCLHIPADTKSTEIQAISTTKGHYKVHLLMFGTKVAPGIWQRYITITSDFPEVCVFEEHLDTLNKILSKIDEVGIHIKEEKCNFFQSCYLGHKIFVRGLEKIPEKMTVVIHARIPDNITNLFAI